MTPLLLGFGRKKLIEMLPILFVSNPFFTSLVPFFFFFDNWNPKKIRLSRLIMGFLFYYTCSNDSMSAVYQGRSKKNFNHFYKFPVCPYTWPVDELVVVDRITQRHFLTSIKINLREKFFLKNFHGLFISPPHFTCKIFTFLDFFYSLRPYKCIGIELDLFPQSTTRNSLYVYYCKHGNRQIESPLPFQSSTQCT